MSRDREYQLQCARRADCRDSRRCVPLFYGHRNRRVGDRQLFLAERRAESGAEAAVRKPVYSGLGACMNTRLHEDLHRTHQTKGFSDRSFAVTFCVFFLLLALLPLRRHQPVQWRWMIASGVFLAVGLVAPGLLHPVSRAWAKLALLLHKIVNPITTAVLYFLIFVPAGYLF